MNLRSALSVPALVLVATLGLSACSNNNGGMNNGGVMGSDSPNNAASLSVADVMFLQMMIPHHEQAVEMSTLAETNSTNPDLLALAARIKAAQGPEIELMKRLLTDAGEPIAMGHSMGSMGSMGEDGMMSDGDMNALMDAKGNAFDVLYLSGMIGHHEGAVMMTKPVSDSSNAEVKTLATNIVASQNAEITEMKKLLASIS